MRNSLTVATNAKEVEALAHPHNNKEAIMSNKYPLMFALHIYNDLNQSTKPSIPPDTTIAGLTELLRERHERGEYITYLSHKNPTGMSFGLVDFVNGLAGGHNP